MHVGLSDMALFRYAKSWTYGFYSAFGMFPGHMLAWICSGVQAGCICLTSAAAPAACGAAMLVPLAEA